MRDVDLKNIVVGAIGGVATDLIIDFPLDAAGLYYTFDLVDPDGVWIWGVGTGELVNALIGGGLILGGEKTRNKNLTEAGFGWLLGMGISKLSELYMYLNYLWQKAKTPPVAGSLQPILAPKFTPGVLQPKYQMGNGSPVTLAEKAARASGTYPGTYVPSRPGEAAVVGYRPATRAVPVREEVGPYAGGITAPKFIPGVLRPKYMHGA